MNRTVTYDPEQWQLVPKVMTGGMLFRFGETTKPYGERWRNTLAVAPQHESQWQDISTAPKDGTHISIKLTDGSVLQNVIPQSDGDYWWNGVSELFISELKVTHWTPLPQHPDTIKVPRPEGHDSWSIEIKTSYVGGGGGTGARVGNYVGGGRSGSYPDTGETTSPESNSPT